MIGIIVADKHELNKFEFPLIEKKTINQFEYSIYEINHKQVVVVHSGIGIVNAAAAAQALINNFDIKEIISYGAVGGDTTTDVYEIVIPNKIYFYDVKTPWYAFGQTPGEKEYYNNALEGTHKHLASGNSFLYDLDEIANIQKQIKVHIFDMETAAIAQIASKNNVPIKVVKCVSDVIGSTEVELENINDRITKAGKLAFKYILKLI